MKIATIIGIRPNFIKCASVSYELRKEFEEFLIHTGQHYDYRMNKIFFDELHIPEPDYHLNVESVKQGQQTGRMLNKIEKTLLRIKPDLVLVYGDCNSTLAGAIAAAKLNIPLAHVEAGLRSFDKTMPEEINRVMTDHCSNLLFCPTVTSITNLKNEGINEGVCLTGDVMVDSLYNAMKVLREASTVLDDFKIKRNNYFVLTLHRASNTNDEWNFKSIIEVVSKLSEYVVFPMHPRNRRLYERNSHLFKKNIMVAKPLGYFDFLNLVKNAKMVLTDSGGLQKEAYILGVPCLTLRDNTEWVETVESGWNILVGPDRKKILDNIDHLTTKQKRRDAFGKGDASKKITKELLEYVRK